jgi:hypothetical protein
MPLDVTAQASAVALDVLPVSLCLVAGHVGRVRVRGCRRDNRWGRLGSDSGKLVALQALERILHRALIRISVRGNHTDGMQARRHKV